MAFSWDPRTPDHNSCFLGASVTALQVTFCPLGLLISGGPFSWTPFPSPPGPQHSTPSILHPFTHVAHSEPAQFPTLANGSECRAPPVSNRPCSCLVSLASGFFRGTYTCELTSQSPRIPPRYALSFPISGISVDGNWTQKYSCARWGDMVTDKLPPHLPNQSSPPQQSTWLGRIPLHSGTGRRASARCWFTQGLSHARWQVNRYYQQVPESPCPSRS